MNNLKISGLYFLSLICLGLVYLTYTPAFEGFDEVGHYSAIRQITFEGKIPSRSDSFLDDNVKNYKGPLPYTSGDPPFDKFLTYVKFFNTENKNVKDRKIGKIEPSYFASEIPNTEYRQHPRLYYLVMTPVQKFVGEFDLVFQVFILRLFSYCMAAAGMGVALYAALTMMTKDVRNQSILASFLMYPLAFPMFVPEFARIGNDSLCILIYSLILLCTVKWKKTEHEKYIWIIGILLGIGLNTKAFYLPISAGMIAYVAVNSFINKFKLLRNVLILISMILLIGSIWYVTSYIEYGTLTGTNIAIAYEENNKIFQFNFENFIKIIRGLIIIPFTFIWGGTYSLVHMPYILYIPSIVIMVYMIYLFKKIIIGKKHFYKIGYLYISIIFMLFGFVWHAYVNLVAGGINSNTPGWYLHIFAPIFAITISYFLENKSFRDIYKIYFIYMIFFNVLVNWFQISLFSGCATKSNSKQYAFSDNLYCLTQLSTIYENLSSISLLNIMWLPVLFFILTYLHLFIKSNEKN